MKKFKLFVPAILAATGAQCRINTETLPEKAWNIHSGYAPAAGEEVHSLKSQVIEGTKNLVLRTESGATLSVTTAEAEVFASDFLKSQGYKLTPPRTAAH